MKNNTPFFSVVIPVYNKGPHIHRSISSVLAQTFEDYELILINDASTDNSLEEMQKFSDYRIRIMHRDEPGPGGYAARNLGIKEARGEWVAFLDADDEWENHYLENVYRGIKNVPEVKIVSCGWKTVSANETTTNKYYNLNLQKGIHVFTINDFIAGPSPIWTSVATINRLFLKSSGGFNTDYLHGGDLELWLRLLLVYKASGLWLPIIGASYHTDSVNMVTKNFTQLFSPVRLRVKAYLEENHSIDPSFKQKLKRFYSNNAARFIKRQLKKGKCDRSYINTLVYWDVLRPKEKLFLFVFGYMPFYLQKFVARLLLK